MRKMHKIFLTNSSDHLNRKKEIDLSFYHSKNGQVHENFDHTRSPSNKKIPRAEHYYASQTVDLLTDQHSDNREVHFYLTCRVHYENIVYLYVTRGDPSIVANFERVPQTIGCLADLLANQRNDLKGNSIEKIFSNLVQRGLSHGAVHCKSLFELFLKLF